MLLQKYMKEDSPPWHIACGLARDGLPQEAGSLCRLKKKLDKITEEKKSLRTSRHHVWLRRSLSCKLLEVTVTGGVSLPASLALIIFPQQILVTTQCRIFIETETWSDTAWLFSCPSSVNHKTCTTELQIFTACGDCCLTSPDTYFRHKNQALFWTHCGEDSC